MSILVYVEKNSDSDDKYLLGEFDSCEKAILACKKIIDDFLLGAYSTRKQTANELYLQFVMFGEDPYIISDTSNSCSFSSRSYAKQRCIEIVK